MFTPELRQASSDLRWLYDRGYSRSASVKLVGDRYQLDRKDRLLLFRGVSSTAASSRRNQLIVGPSALKGHSLAVDGHNVLLTVANYIAGIPVFEADDGIIRDIGALHGRVHAEAVMRRSLDLVSETLKSLDQTSLFIAFDSPVSHSRDHAGYLRERTAMRSITIAVTPSGDKAIRERNLEFVATSDSALIETLGRGVLDLARLILEKTFDVKWESFVS
ncbi:MAG: DUF434 domain-containing protein [Spirochaetaceae bacterium]|nr:DUF434 domain-containing protein [Spirochaetaceae bacterium]MDT8298471.1 DUF434 domain-containing protein [Spirochaetaceae bacterium]